MKNILSKRIRQCRKNAKLTQREVATYSDITEKTYQNYELKSRIPKIDILVRIADTFKVSLDYLAGRTDVKEVNTGNNNSKNN